MEATSGTKDLTLEIYCKNSRTQRYFNVSRSIQDTLQKRKFLKNLIKLEMFGKIAHKKSGANDGANQLQTSKKAL